MERLQLAIEKARERRNNRVPATRRNHPSNVDLTWEGLEAFEPDASLLRRKRVITTVRAKGRTAIDMLRTRLLTLMYENRWRRVMVTSPTPGCGKSTVTANLAFALQRQTELRSVVMDLDLTRASLGGLIGLKPTHDISALLSGEVTPPEQLRRVGSNLAFSVSGRGDPNRSELIKSSTALRAIEAIEADFRPDIMLFDFPPFFATDDTIAAARFVDCAIIVSEAGRSSVSEVDITERDLAQYTQIAGIVLNKCRYEERGASYGAGYD